MPSARTEHRSEGDSRCSTVAARGRGMPARAALSKLEAREWRETREEGEGGPPVSRLGVREWGDMRLTLCSRPPCDTCLHARTACTAPQHTTCMSAQRSMHGMHAGMSVQHAQPGSMSCTAW